MNKIDWKRKLTSRKFWMAIAGFVSMLVVAFGGSENQATQITSLIMAGAAVVAYIIGGWIGTYVVVKRRLEHRRGN